LCKGAEVLTAAILLMLIHTTTRSWPQGRSLRLAPANRYGYLLTLIAMGVFAMVVVLHIAGHFSGHIGEAWPGSGLASDWSGHGMSTAEASAYVVSVGNVFGQAPRT